jgi:hypothetical protein
LFLEAEVDLAVDVGALVVESPESDDEEVVASFLAADVFAGEADAPVGVGAAPPGAAPIMMLLSSVSTLLT